MTATAFLILIIVGLPIVVPAFLNLEERLEKWSYRRHFND